jgi:hypothetical protein
MRNAAFDARSSLIRGWTPAKILHGAKDSSNKGDKLFNMLYTSAPSGMLVDANHCLTWVSGENYAGA